MPDTGMMPLWATLSDYVNLPLWAGIVTAIVVLGASSVLFWRASRKRKQLEKVYQEHLATWTNALAVSNQSDSLEANPDNLVLETPPFAGASKDEHAQARKLWAKFAAQRGATARALSRAEERFKQYKAYPLWRPGSLHLLKQAVEELTTAQVTVGQDDVAEPLAALRPLVVSEIMPGGDLPAQLRITSAAGAQELKRFTDAVAVVRASTKALADELSGDADISIARLKQSLTERGLALEPYERRFEDLDAQAADLTQQLLSNPLLPQVEQVDKLKRKINMMRRRLQRATELHEVARACRHNLGGLRERVEKLRLTPVPAELPELRINNTYTLDEPGFVIDDHLAQCEALCAQLFTTLHEAALLRFTRLQADLQAALTETERLLNTALADQKHVEQQLATITRECQSADLQADSAERQVICQLYALQHWHAASKAVSSLSARHLLRKTARTALANLDQELARFCATAGANANITPVELDADIAIFTADAAQLCSAGQQGQADWRALIESTAQATDRLRGDHPASLAARLNVQLDMHEKARTAVTHLDDRLKQLWTHVGEGWGGNQAASALAEIQPRLQSVLEAAGTPKQDWQALESLAGEAMALSQPVKDLVWAEIERYNTLAQQLQAFSTMLQKCADETYSRTICDTTYGQGLYCVTSTATKHFQKALGALQTRNYEGTAAELQAAKEDLFGSHLECCWMILQMMAHSEEICARAYAHEQGYVDGGFAAWQKRLSSGWTLYTPPAVNYNKHVGKKRNLQFLSPRPFDEPTAKDYEGNYVLTAG
jgi:hypothetical protein